MQKDVMVIGSGGRVLGVTGYSPKGIVEAQINTYDAVDLIKTREGFHYRTDIADKATRK